TGEFLTTLPYGREYACAVNKEGYLFYSQHFSLRDFKVNEPYNLDIYLIRPEVGTSVVLNNIFFEVNKYGLRSESQAELNTLIALMEKNPTLTIEIGGHTDNSGNDSDNQVLSERRAKAVVEYLTERGIAVSRLSYQGYGSSKPVVPNTTPENKQLNRRTEFVVTGI